MTRDVFAASLRACLRWSSHDWISEKTMINSGNKPIRMNIALVIVLSLVGPQMPSPPLLTANADGARASTDVTTDSAKRAVRLRLIGGKPTGRRGCVYLLKRRQQRRAVVRSRLCIGHRADVQVPDRRLEHGRLKRSRRARAASAAGPRHRPSSTPLRSEPGAGAAMGANRSGPSSRPASATAPALWRSHFRVHPGGQRPGAQADALSATRQP